MKPEHYTDEDLRLAILDASDQRSIFISTAYELEDIDSSAVRSLRTLLAHLPDPATDEWQECVWLDILHTDKRVKAEYASGTIIEGVPDGISEDGIYLADRLFIPYSENAKWYRIPAPVQHPDPDVHKYILDVDGDLWIWSKSQRKYIEPETLVQSAPAEIDEWTPAKVVEDDR